MTSENNQYIKKILVEYRESLFNVKIGKLTLTKDMLIFEPHKISNQGIIEIKISEIKSIQQECDRIFTIFIDNNIKYKFLGDLEFGPDSEFLGSKKYVSLFIDNILKLNPFISINVANSRCLKDFIYRHPVLFFFLAPIVFKLLYNILIFIVDLFYR